MVRIGSFVAVMMAFALVGGLAIDQEAQPPGKPVESDGASGQVEAPPSDELAKARAETNEQDEADQPVRAVVEPKRLSQSVIRGLDWLVAQQHPTGGWGQGEESARMHRPHLQDGQNLRDLPNVADTAMAALALIRSGSTPAQGAYSTSINRAIEFVCDEIEQADDESLWISSVRGTRVQSKIGPYVDTFLAALLLTEVKDHMPTDESNERVMAALTKTISKIERHQQENGQWAGRAWAGGLSNAIAVKALNRASQLGIAVDEEVRMRAEQSAQFRAQTGSDGRFRDDGQSAGIELYAAANAVGELNDAFQANVARRATYEGRRGQAETEIAVLARKLSEANSNDEKKSLEEQIAKLETMKEAAAAQLQRFDQVDADRANAVAAVTKRLTDDRFVAGFGTNGGEEFISYLNIGETLVVEGGEAWEEFDKRMTENLTRVQNDDGSWTGHHCITGRTFCTASALLVLMVDRSPNPIADTLSRR